jgi:DNA-binding CsgD family transcriptional regulator
MAERRNQQVDDGGGPIVRALLARALASGQPVRTREDIVGSWRRSASAGLTPDSFEVPYDADVDDRGRLAWAARAVLDRIGEDLHGTRIGLVLTDATGRVVARRAHDGDIRGLLDEIRLAPGFVYAEEQIGTNAIGTALRRRAPTLVEAEEHFAEALVRMACAAVTVTDPWSGRVLGTVDLSCAAADLNPLMLPLAKRAGWEIEQRLLDEGSTGDKLLKQQFLRARRATRAPLLAISGRSFLANAAGTDLVAATERDRLWDCALKASRAGQASFAFVATDRRLITFRCEPVQEGPHVVGVLLTVDEPPPGRPGGTARARSAPRGVGWESLTETELAVAAQVSRGLTNREVGAAMFLSPHTVDFHLRQLFRKLEIGSRVELTRVVLEHQGE